MPLYVKRLSDSAQIPVRLTEYSAGLDLVADEDMEIPEYSRAWVKTGIAIALDPYLVGQVWPRSGLAGHGIDTSAGIIDADYRGEIKVLLCNGTPHRKRINRGDRIAQLVIVIVARPSIVDARELPPSERAANGFGSTGI